MAGGDEFHVWSQDYRRQERAIALAREAYLATGGFARASPRTLVADSWVRSRLQGVDPARRQIPMALSPDEVAQANETLEVALVARPILLKFSELMQQSGHALLLCDAAGRVLQAAGDVSLHRAAEAARSVPGGQWSEAAAGTNAVGIALQIGHPAQISLSEHYCEGWLQWTCAAAPVRDAAGELVGVVDISGYREPPHPHTLALAESLAADVGRALRRRAEQRFRVLQREVASRSLEFPSDAVVAVDRQGRIRAANALANWVFNLERAVGEQLPLAAVPGLARVLGTGPELSEREGLAEDSRHDRLYRVTMLPVLHEGTVIGTILLIRPLAGRLRTPAPVADSAAPASAASAFAAEAAEAPFRLVARVGERRVLVPPEKVYCAQIRGEAIWLRTADGELEAVTGGMKELEGRLVPAGFFRANRTSLVNLRRVKEIHPLSRRTVDLVLGDAASSRVTVSRRRTTHLRRLLHF